MQIILDYKCREAISENGFHCNGVINISSETDASILVGQMKRMLVNIPRYQYKRFRSVIMQICIAYGPEFTENHGPKL